MSEKLVAVLFCFWTRCLEVEKKNAGGVILFDENW